MLLSNKEFNEIIEERGLEPLFYKIVYDKCTDYIKLIGDEYKIAMDLHEFGLMSIKKTPILRFNKLCGYMVYFKSEHYNGENNLFI